MVHLGGGVADTRGSRFLHYLCYKRGGAKSPYRAEKTEYMIMQVGYPIGLNGLYHQQKEGNEHKRESCLVEFISRPPSAGRRLRFRRTCMKTRLEVI